MMREFKNYQGLTVEGLMAVLPLLTVSFVRQLSTKRHLTLNNLSKTWALPWKHWPIADDGKELKPHKPMKEKMTMGCGVTNRWFPVSQKLGIFLGGIAKRHLNRWSYALLLGSGKDPIISYHPIWKLFLDFLHYFVGSWCFHYLKRSFKNV